MKTVMLAVNCEDDTDVLKVMEILGRAQAGLILDGYQAMMMAQDPEEAPPGDAQGAGGCRYPGPPCG